MMKTYKKRNKIVLALFGEKNAVRRILMIGMLVTATQPLAALSQTANDHTIRNNNNQASIGSGKTSTRQSTPIAQQQLTPLVDYHTHLWSLNANSQVVDPLLPAVELPEDLKRLLVERERLGKEKNPTVLAPLYTSDALVLDAMAPRWIRGVSAIEFVAYDLGNFPLIPQAYQVNGSEGYIVGTYARTKNAIVSHVSNFSLFIRKGTDGKWRIAVETYTLKGPPVPKAATAEQLVAQLDAAGIKRAVVLSTAYWFGGASSGKPEEEYAKVRAENEWFAEQVGRYPTRLVGFCSFNPLKDYALRELDRCTKNPNLKGLKLHFGNSRVDVLDRQHIEKIREVFRAANDKRFPIAVHLWTGGKYGREHSEKFLSQIVSAAPEIPIQIAHLAAAGPGYHSDDALEVYANAATAGNPLMKNLYFDVATIVTEDTSATGLELVAKRLRQLGMQRILLASDYAPGYENPAPKDAWEAFRRLPLTGEEFRIIAGNVVPSMR